MSHRSDLPREGDRHRRLHLALTAAVALLALFLTTWLLARPGARIADVGSSPGAGSPAVSTASTPSAATSGSLTPSPSGTTPATTGTSGSATPVAPVAPVPVAFIGDGLTPTASSASASPASPAADAQDWAALATADLASAGTPITATTAAQGGSGYSAMVAGGLNFAELVPQAVTSSTRVVVLLGSSSDAGRSTAAVRRGAEAALSIIKALSPQASVLVVAPLPDQAGPPSPALRAVLSQAAAAGGATFVDPVAAGWPATTTSAGPSDADQLTASGQAAVATSVAASLRPLVQATATPNSPAPAATTTNGG